MQGMNYLEVSRRALVENARAVCDYVKVPVIGVVKCDGYGVTVVEAARAWQQGGASMFAVSTPEEAVQLRHAGFREDILLLCPVCDRETAAELADENIILTVTGLSIARLYATLDTPVRCHVAVDTGMGRFGVHWRDITQLEQIYGTENLLFEGLFSHFSKSFEDTFQTTCTQLNRFLHVAGELEKRGFPVGMRHIANSCAALRFPETRLDAVRIGSALVGLLGAQVPVTLQPAARFYAQVIERKCLHPGDTTGYGAYCRIHRDTEVAVVCVGSRDGFGCTAVPDRLRLRDLLSWLRHTLMDYYRRPGVYYGGRRLGLVGRIGSQFTLFEVTGVELPVGDYVQVDVPQLHHHQSIVFR